MSARGIRLENSGWTPCEKARAFATECGLDPDEIWADFCDYWTAKPGANASKLDWLATWRNWCRRNKQSRARGISSRFETRNSDSLPAQRREFSGGIQWPLEKAIGAKRKQALRQPLDSDEQQALEQWYG